MTNSMAAQPAHIAHLLALRTALEGAPVVRRDRHARIVPTRVIRVRTHLGAGRLVSLTDDAWVEVQLDGEDRCDEYAIEAVTLA